MGKKSSTSNYNDSYEHFTEKICKIINLAFRWRFLASYSGLIVRQFRKLASMPVTIIAVTMIRRK